MIEDVSTYRSKEQVLFDLSKAMHFSPDSLELNRHGKLSADQFKHYIRQCVRSAVTIAACFLAPFLMWTSMTAARQQVSFDEAFRIFLRQLVHVGGLIESQGKVGALTEVGSTLILLGLALFFASRFPLKLYADLLERSVVTKEGRVVAREEQTMRPNGRDPIERYYFGMKGDYYDVSLAAFRAIENGSVYKLYLLPRSQVLISMEPKLTAGAAP